MSLDDLIQEQLKPDYQELGETFLEELKRCMDGLDAHMIAEALEKAAAGESVLIQYAVEIDDMATSRRFRIDVNMTPSKVK